MADQLAVLLAPLLGAWLYKTVGVAWILGMGAIFYFSVSALSLWITRGVGRPVRLDRGWNLRRDLNSIFKTVSENRFLQVVLWLTLVDNFLIGLQGASLTPIALGVFHETEQTYGMALTISSVFCPFSAGWFALG